MANTDKIADIKVILEEGGTVNLGTGPRRLTRFEAGYLRAYYRTGGGKHLNARLHLIGNRGAPTLYYQLVSEPNATP